MSRRRAGALGALLSVSFLSCLFALLLVAEQAFPPAPSLDGGLGLPAPDRSPLVVAGGSGGSALAAPTAIAPAPVAEVAAPVVDAAADQTLFAGGGSDLESRDDRPRDRRRESRTPDREGDRDPQSPTPSGSDGTEGGESPGHGGTPPGHGGIPPGQAKKDSADLGNSPDHGSNSSDHGNTSPGHGGTPPGQAKKGGDGVTSPGHGGTPPGQAKKDNGGHGRGKGHSKH
jgi:hypothetical protein